MDVAADSFDLTRPVGDRVIPLALCCPTKILDFSIGEPDFVFNATRGFGSH
jgi:hypothetical protein